MASRRQVAPSAGPATTDRRPPPVPGRHSRPGHRQVVPAGDRGGNGGEGAGRLLDGRRRSIRVRSDGGGRDRARHGEDGNVQHGRTVDHRRCDRLSGRDAHDVRHGHRNGRQHRLEHRRDGSHHGLHHRPENRDHRRGDRLDRTDHGDDHPLPHRRHDVRYRCHGRLDDRRHDGRDRRGDRRQQAAGLVRDCFQGSGGSGGGLSSAAADEPTDPASQIPAPSPTSSSVAETRVRPTDGGGQRSRARSSRLLPPSVIGSSRAVNAQPDSFRDPDRVARWGCRTS